MKSEKRKVKSTKRKSRLRDFSFWLRGRDLNLSVFPNSLRRIWLRSPRGSDSPPDCHSLPLRPFAQRLSASLTTSELFARRAHNPCPGIPSLLPQPTQKGHRMVSFALVAGEGLEPLDLRVMSPTSYQLLYPAMYEFGVVPVTGLEPVRYSRITGF